MKLDQASRDFYQHTQVSLLTIIASFQNKGKQNEEVFSFLSEVCFFVLFLIIMILFLIVEFDARHRIPDEMYGNCGQITSISSQKRNRDVFR